MHWFIHWCIDSFIDALIQSFIQSFINSYIDPLIIPSQIPEEEIEAFLQMIEQVIRELMQLAESVDQWEGEGEMPMDYGGYFGMAEPMPEPGMPMAEPGRDEWMPFAGAEPHGGRDEEDELSRPSRSQDNFEMKDSGQLL